MLSQTFLSLLRGILNERPRKLAAISQRFDLQEGRE